MDCLPDVSRDVFLLRSGMDFFGAPEVSTNTRLK